MKYTIYRRFHEDLTRPVYILYYNIILWYILYTASGIKYFYNMYIYNKYVRLNAHVSAGLCVYNNFP